MGRLTDTDRDTYPEYLDTLPDQTQPYIYLSGYNGQGYNALDLSEDGSTSGTKRMPDYYKQSGTTGWNPKSFQIISAGRDNDYGAGGDYDPKTASSQITDGGIDNITNFSSGLLVK
jgi:hypothetical protein